MVNSNRRLRIIFMSFLICLVTLSIFSLALQSVASANSINAYILCESNESQKDAESSESSPEETSTEEDATAFSLISKDENTEKKDRSPMQILIPAVIFVIVIAIFFGITKAKK